MEEQTEKKEQEYQVCQEGPGVLLESQVQLEPLTCALGPVGLDEKRPAVSHGCGPGGTWNMRRNF